MNVVDDTLDQSDQMETVDLGLICNQLFEELENFLQMIELNVL